MELEPKKVYHHHTPRFYLLPWADRDERILWLGYGKIVRSGLTVVGGENHFYTLQELTEDDRNTLRTFIGLMPEMGRDAHEQLVEFFDFPFAMKRHIEETGVNAEQTLRQLDLLIANGNEDYHSSIENRLRPLLKCMLRGDTSFYGNSESAADFLHCICVQNLRTKTMKERMLNLIPAIAGLEMNERVWPIMCHIFATVVAGSLWVDKERFKIVLVENDTEVPFITSDQPIFNLRAPAYIEKSPDRLEFFYPLSPTKAMLYLEKKNPLHTMSHRLSIDEVHSYNLQLADHSGLQIFSNSEEYLKVIQRYMQEHRRAECK